MFVQLQFDQEARRAMKIPRYDTGFQLPTERSQQQHFERSDSKAAELMKTNDLNAVISIACRHSGNICLIRKVRSSTTSTQNQINMFTTTNVLALITILVTIMIAGYYCFVNLANTFAVIWVVAVVRNMIYFPILWTSQPVSVLDPWFHPIVYLWYCPTSQRRVFPWYIWRRYWGMGDGNTTEISIYLC